MGLNVILMIFLVGIPGIQNELFEKIDILELSETSENGGISSKFASYVPKNRGRNFDIFRYLQLI